MVRLTHHGEMRGRKRLGVGKKTLPALVQQAKLNGVQHHEFKGLFRNYLDQYAYNYGKKNGEILVYKHDLYIFAGDVLITTWPLPSKYRKLAKEVQDRIHDRI